MEIWGYCLGEWRLWNSCSGLFAWCHFSEVIFQLFEQLCHIHSTLLTAGLLFGICVLIRKCVVL